MILESIEPGTSVFSNDYGKGTFIKWLDDAVGSVAIIYFNGDNFNRAIKGRKLTEIEQ